MIKLNTYSFLVLKFFIVTGCGSYDNISDLTMISNHNVDSGKEYVLINRDL